MAPPEYSQTHPMKSKWFSLIIAINAGVIYLILKGNRNIVRNVSDL